MSKFKTNQTYNSEVFLEEIEVFVPKADFDEYFQKALEDISKSSSAPGFRKGKVPKNVVLANRYNQIADRSIELIIADTIKDFDNLDPKPLEPFHVKSIDSVSDSADSDLKIVLTYLPMPKVEIADLAKIKVDKPESRKAEKEEIEKEIQNIWFSYAQKLDANIKKEDYSKDKLDKEFFEKSGILNENAEINSYENLEKFVEEFINRTYEQSATVDWDEKIKTELVANSKYEKVEALVNRELDKRLENYFAKFREIGMDPKEYLEKNNINLDDLRKEWQEQAERDVKFELILQEYGKQKEIAPTEDEVNQELSRLDPQTKKTYDNDEERLRNLINYYFVNNKAYIQLFNEVREANK